MNYNNREIQKEIGKQWIFCLFLFRSNSMIFMTTKCSLTLFQCLCIFQYLRHIQHVPAIYRIDNLPTIESIQNYITICRLKLETLGKQGIFSYIYFVRLICCNQTNSFCFCIDFWKQKDWQWQKVVSIACRRYWNATLACAIWWSTPLFISRYPTSTFLKSLSSWQWAA